MYAIHWTKIPEILVWNRMDRSVKTEKFRKSGLDVRSSIFAYQKHNIIFKCRFPYREQIQIKKTLEC